MHAVWRRFWSTYGPKDGVEVLAGNTHAAHPQGVAQGSWQPRVLFNLGEWRGEPDPPPGPLVSLQSVRDDSYQVERRERPVGDWAIAGMALKSEIMLVNQGRAKDLEYRVVPINNSGPGEPSTTIVVVL